MQRGYDDAIIFKISEFLLWVSASQQTEIYKTVLHYKWQFFHFL